MRLRSLRVHSLSIPLKQRFAHALSARHDTEPLIVELVDEEGRAGFGEILPRAYLTGETGPTVLAEELPRQAARLAGPEFESFAQVVSFLGEALDLAGRALATAGGLELALLDLAGRRFGVSAGLALADRPGPAPAQGVVIGFEVETAALPRHCAVLRFGGRRFVKLKLGRPDDLERVRIAADVLAGVPLRLDANEAYASADEAIRAVASFPRDRLHSLEQPLPAADLAGARRLREATGVKLMADEGLVSVADGERLIAAGAVDIFNVRVGKCGGLLGAARLVRLAERAGLGVHLGTLVGETGVLSRASEIFGRFGGTFDYLEGRGQNEHLLSDDVLSEPRLAREADPLAPGLGVTVDGEKLTRYRLAEPISVTLA